ncbi:Beta-galactosidase [Austwickia sp. TVS 96-490-7B]|nr:Beta-galactosidase [Austwickia sp. TVS 96-490-7B]
MDLSGTWSLRTYPDPRACPTDPDTAVAAAVDTVPVPSHWVLSTDGHGAPIYTNVAYPFPIDPPHVPDDNPTADHVRVFDLPRSWPQGRTLLRFDGVESCYRIWLNGNEIGVGTGSRLVQEFDVTAALTPGRNTLLVRVHQWSAGSYLEDQDQWWLPGIFRDVTLLSRPEGCLNDLWLQCDYDAVRRTGTVTAQIDADESAWPITVDIPALRLHHVWASPQDVAPITMLVRPWSAEDPMLYDAHVTAQGEKVTVRVGFRTVAIVDGMFTVNGAPIRFRGVNRHEISPTWGRVDDPEQTRRELVAMKRHHINAIRTSHYPPHPRVLELCDELGMWVVDECDLETHGFHECGWEGNPSDEPAWQDVLLDRMIRTVERDKNHPCVVMWSLGNEAGMGRNLAQMAQWTRERDPGRPIHYERDFSCEYVDVYGRMYPTLRETEQVGRGAWPLVYGRAEEAARIFSRPCVLTEYAHAMGTGPGGLADYEALFDRYPRLHGGFVWEWRDHGLLTHRDGRAFYGYGGDFGEQLHDGNFVIDGLCHSDGRPSPALTDYAHVISPVRLTPRRGEDGSVDVLVENRFDLSTTAAVEFPWRVEHDGVVVADGRLDVPLLSARRRVVVPVDLASLPAGKPRVATLTVTATTTADTPWARAGHLLGHGQVVLAENPQPRPAPTRWQPRRQGRTLVWRTPGHELCWDASTGRLTGMDGLALDGPEVCLWRAPTDNDRLAGEQPGLPGDPTGAHPQTPSLPTPADLWAQEQLALVSSRLVDIRVGEDTMHVSSVVAAPSRRHRLQVTTTYQWCADQLVCRVEALPDPGWKGSWARAGMRWRLPPHARWVEWLGLGPYERYPDSGNDALVGRYVMDLATFNPPMARPQECGSRAEVRTATITWDERALTVVTTAINGVHPSLSVHEHPAAEIAQAGHPVDLPESRATWMYVDAAQHPLGSRSCGPGPAPESVLTPQPFTVDIALRVRL